MAIRSVTAITTSVRTNARMARTVGKTGGAGQDVCRMRLMRWTTNAGDHATWPPVLAEYSALLDKLASSLPPDYARPVSQ